MQLTARCVSYTVRLNFSSSTVVRADQYNKAVRAGLAGCGDRALKPDPLTRCIGTRVQRCDPDRASLLWWRQYRTVFLDTIKDQASRKIGAMVRSAYLLEQHEAPLAVLVRITPHVGHDFDLP